MTCLIITLKITTRRKNDETFLTSKYYQKSTFSHDIKTGIMASHLSLCCCFLTWLKL